jgi:hypothetical protein
MMTLRKWEGDGNPGRQRDREVSPICVTKVIKCLVEGSQGMRHESALALQGSRRC